MLNPFSTARSSTISAALVSWTLAGVTTTARTNPSEQLRTWRLMPLIFLLPSNPRSPCKCRVNTPQIGRMKIPQADATARLGSRRLGAVQPLIAHSSLSRLREGLGGHTWGTRHDSRSRPPGFERVGDRAPDRPGPQDHPQVRRQG